MDKPKSSPVLEVSRSNSVADERLPKPSSSLSQSLVDLTKQLLSWPRYGVPLNSAEEETEQKIELSDYSLAKAQWTPSWPENFAEEENTPSKEEIERNGEISEYSLAKAHWTPNWPGNFVDEENAHSKGEIQGNSEIPESYRIDPNQSDQNDVDLLDKKNLDTSSLKTISKLSFDTTEDWETAEEIDKETGSEYSDARQPGSTSQKAVHDDDVRSFDDLLYKIASSIDVSKNADEDITDVKKCFVDLGNNRNYIKTLINYDLNNNSSKDIKSRKDFEKRKLNQKFKWSISYDNSNYIRSLLSPNTFEKILNGDLFKRKEPSKQRK